ncbi:hypothetical protein PMI01_01148 [Caulobacter sp. AP07]|uniref:hypothetical protein n=1 Tax=Caulobacter sp. AP07 TaxID=1144304 RepID=UPI000271E85A|nr:hypothetical protein [Caulobacter sp. AP07]EJL35981.1 hypothetical protein PMI01_01148 [Caulobacter sp. AP07]
MSLVEALLAVVTIAAAVISGLADLDGAWERCRSIRKAFKKTFEVHTPWTSRFTRTAGDVKKNCQISQKEIWTARSPLKKNAAGFGFSKLLTPA